MITNYKLSRRIMLAKTFAPRVQRQFAMKFKGFSKGKLDEIIAPKAIVAYIRLDKIGKNV